ncbi:deoxyribodipyrimidine photo-lyase [Methanobacterium sp. ACI-7]|uniref:deoxyribodipyrimidine photo-lyase n=1 Tax=unclassified Methanobacterium TaxID=2627676 RepID=UPI0039C1F17D
MIQEERIQKLNDDSLKEGNYILYWMQSSQRAHYNHALEYSILKSNELNIPLLVYFGLTPKFPEANKRHYYFMLQGLNNTMESLKERNINFIILNKSPDECTIKLSKNASMVVVDRGYLKIERLWRENAAKKINCPLIQVESNVIIPVETASQKEEYSAATLRRKINKILNNYLVPLKHSKLENSYFKEDIISFDIKDIESTVKNLNIDESVREVENIKGGTDEALKKLHYFIENKLDNYQNFKNDPNYNYLSNMSPYLHFGQISPLYIALEILKSDSKSKEAYLEELIIRRELSMNFVYYNQNYDSLNCLPDWAQKTVLEHKKDKRKHIYSLKQLENAETGDPYWNASQKEMIITGKMHGYMRMYWGKKIIEWTENPEDAHIISLYLNNKYEIDGRDANGFTGVAWCFGKHDRAWKEREIFGKVRYMNENGLKRKFDADAYVKKIHSISNNVK